MLALMQELTAAIEAGQAVALATVIDVSGASPARLGFSRPSASWRICSAESFSAEDERISFCLPGGSARPVECGRGECAWPADSPS